MLARRLAPGIVLPTSKTWSTKATALDQGNTGTCVGHGWANFLRCAPIQSNAGIDALRWQIYKDAILLDEWPDNDYDPHMQYGTSVRAGAQATTNLSRLKSYLWAFSLQPTIEWVLTQGPVVLGTNWYDSMFHTDVNGLLTIKPRAKVVGGHCYLLRGVNTKKALATCSNSWGDSWGESGDFYLSFKDLERLILEDGEVCTAIEKKVTAAK